MSQSHRVKGDTTDEVFLGAVFSVWRQQLLSAVIKHVHKEIHKFTQGKCVSFGFLSINLLREAKREEASQRTILYVT